MRPLRLPHLSSSSRLLPVHGAPIAAACTLALAVLAGVACDENAPTETRAPSRTTPVSVELDEANSTQQSDVSTTSIALPVNQSVSTVAPNPAFRINQIGTGPNGIFQISSSINTQTALQGLTNGRGRAGFFRISNTANSLSALQAQTNGSGLAVDALATGTGGGGSFEITNSANFNNALFAQTNGSGLALEALQRGTGSAGLFQIVNVNNAGSAVSAVTNGSGSALSAGTTGIGEAASFSIINPSNSRTALSARTNGSGPAFVAFQDGVSDVGGAFLITNGSNPGDALRAATNGTGMALDVIGPSHFLGNVIVQGRLTKSAGSFRIDHPLDPEHKYLSHSFVESPDMKNVYDGTVVLDADGRATVELPDYFEALNRDFRYQLTPIGAPGPNLYIAEGVQHNHFRIAGGRPYAHVSWQVTGVRHDTYAEEHRIRVEEEKPADEQKQRPAGHLIAQR